MPTLESTNINATTLYEQINRNIFLMPRFQRKFRWKPRDKKAFVDTLFRNVFCGAMLHIANNECLTLSSRTVSIAVNDAEKYYDGDLKANHQQVLDGQQRICTFAEIFCNTHKNHGWYLDVVKLGSEVWESNTDDRSWILFFSKSNHEPYRSHKKDEDTLLVRADMIFSDQQEAAMRCLKWFQKNAEKQYGHLFDDLPSEERKESALAFAEKTALRVLQRFEQLRKYNFTVGHLDSSSDIEEILLNFVRINNQGVKLSLYELSVPRYLRWFDICEHTRAALKKHPVFKASIGKEHGLGWALLVVSTLAIRGRNALKKSAVFDLDGDVLRDTWPKAVEALAKAYAWGRDHIGCYYRDAIPGHAPFVGLAAALTAEPDYFEKVDPLELKRWFFSKLYRAAPPTYEEWRDCFLSLVKPVQTGEPLDIPPMLVSLDTVLTLGNQYRGGTDAKRRSRARAIQCFAHAEGDLRDLATGEHIREVVQKPRFSLNRFHIYPKSKKHTLPFSVDACINITLSTKKTNDKVKTNSPADYLFDFIRKFENDTAAVGLFGTDNPRDVALREMNDRLRSCFLLAPGEAFESVEDIQSYFAPQNMEQVMTNRGRTIFERLKQVMGPCLRQEDPELWNSEAIDDEDLVEDEEEDEEDEDEDEEPDLVDMFGLE